MSGIKLGVEAAEFVEEDERVRAVQVNVAVEDVNFSPFGEEAIVAISDAFGEFAQSLVAHFIKLRIAEHDELRLQPLGHDLLSHCVSNEPTSAIELAHTALAPVDNLGREHTANSEFLTKAEQEDVDCSG